MREERYCLSCGQPIPFGYADCPSCFEPKGWLWSLDRQTILLFSLLALIIFFVVTAFVARLYHSKRQALAEEWFSRGQAELSAGRGRLAVESFRTALVYLRNDVDYQMQLARALEATGQPIEAQAYLLNIWEHEPGNGAVNLELARLSARRGNLMEAVQYYHGAIYGEWPSDPPKQRRNARIELCQFLLERGVKGEAQAELIALASDLPQDAALHTEAGQLFIMAGLDDRALNEFRQAFGLDRKQQAAISGAAEADFELGKYREARVYLERALRANPHEARAARRLELVNLLLDIDPFDPSLSGRESRRRVIRAFAQALTRIQDCARKPGEPLDKVKEQSELESLFARAMKMKPKVHEITLRRDHDLLVNVMELVFEIEQLTARECGAPEGLDEALLLVARRRGSADP